MKLGAFSISLTVKDVKDSKKSYEKLGVNVFLEEQILSEEQLKEIWTPVKRNSVEDGYFGLGWESYRLRNNNRMVGHGGAGISSFNHFWNEQTRNSLTVILLTNGAKNWIVRPNQINLEIFNIIFPETNKI